MEVIPFTKDKNEDVLATVSAYQADMEGGWHPTKKGLTVQLDAVQGSMYQGVRAETGVRAA